MPENVSKPISLSVKLAAVEKQVEDHLAGGLKDLYQRGAFTDVALVCADSNMYAHRVVLAAESDVFKHGLEATAPVACADGARRTEMRLSDISSPEAVKLMLDYMYKTDSSVFEEYNPKTQEINKDVLRLAQNFKLNGLKDRATHWLAKGITTGNVVERLTMCDDFGLTVLGEKILDQIICNKRALAEVVRSPLIMKHPKLMQALLQASATPAAAVQEDKAPQGAAKKKARKA